ncbi:MAG: ribbon-helix-helix protein, CopG family [Nitrospirae bacterium]|nr:ribbon-helix-helix protein, CopG family [Nitrospirota bacterium]
MKQKQGYTLTAFQIRESELDLVRRTAKDMGVSASEVMRRAVLSFLGTCPTCRRPFKQAKKGETP